MKPLTARQVEDILKRNQWRLDHTRGSHFIWKNSTGRIVPVPHHGNGPLPQGTLQAIFRQAGITPPRP